MEDNRIFWIKDQIELDEFSAGGRFILYFSSKGCNVCHSVFPKLIQLLKDHPIDIGRIDVDDSKKLAGQSLIFSIPTIIIFDEGREIHRESRFIDFLGLERLFSIMFQ